MKHERDPKMTRHFNIYYFFKFLFLYDNNNNNRNNIYIYINKPQHQHLCGSPWSTFQLYAFPRRSSFAHLSYYIIISQISLYVVNLPTWPPKYFPSLLLVTQNKNQFLVNKNHLQIKKYHHPTKPSPNSRLLAFVEEKWPKTKKIKRKKPENNGSVEKVDLKITNHRIRSIFTHSIKLVATTSFNIINTRV